MSADYDVIACAVSSTRVVAPSEFVMESYIDRIITKQYHYYFHDQLEKIRISFVSITRTI